MSNVGNRTYKNENYYVLLGITASATDAEIQQAFRRLARRCHPDKQKGTDDTYLRLSEAYRILTNSDFRKEYDKSRDTVDMREVHIRGYFYNSLPSCKKLSDDIIDDIEKWMKEFQEISIKDNVKEAFEEILKQSDFNKYEFEKDEKAFFCDTCNQEFVSEEDHFDKILEPYVEELVSDVDEEQSTYDLLRTKLGFHELELDYKTCKPDFICSQDLIRQQVLKAENLLNYGHITEANITILAAVTELEAHYSDDEDFVIDILLMIISRCFGDDLYSIGEAMKSVIRCFPTRFSDLNLVHEYFITKYMQADTLGDWKLALAGLHYVDKDDELLNYFTKRSIETLSNILEQAVNDSNFELLSELLSVINPLNSSVLELFIESKSKDYDLERITGDYKAAILMIKGTHAKVKGEIAKSLNYFQKALQACSESPFQSREGIALAVTEQMSNVAFHIKLLEQLWSEFDIIKSNLYKSATVPSIAPELVLSELFSLKLWYKQVSPTGLNVAKKNEDAIKKRLKTPLAMALGYFDLSMAVGLQGILMGLSHVIEAMRTSGNVPLCYAYSKIIEKFSAALFLTVRQQSGPNGQMYVYRLIFSLLLTSSIIFRHKLLTSRELSASSSNTILSETGKTLAHVAVREIVNLAKVYPLIHTPLHSVHDQILRYSGEGTFTTNFIHSRATGQHHSSCFPIHLYTYQEFDSLWRGWGNSELAGSFDDCRLNCMIDMLQARQWKVSDVENIMLWPRIRRTMHGWMNNEEVSLDFDGEPEDEVFSSCRGVEINDETGEITLLFDKGDSTSLKLFTLADVKDVLVNDIDCPFLTLEDPDQTLSSHPFQEFSYRPSSLQGTDYLFTLLHADYFLKELTTGIEVNAYSPFEMRPTRDGLLQRLPPHIQLLLRPILERLRDPICPQSEDAHRFWLEMEKLEGNSVQSKDVVRYEFGNTIISVKTQKLKRTTSGEYIDDEDGSEISSTAEVQLAKALTKNYDDIGTYFPFLLRLKELCKISGILRIIKSRAKRSKDILTVDNSTVISNLNTNQTEMLQGIRSNVKRVLQTFRDQPWSPPHPINCQVNLEHHYKEILRSNNLEFQEHKISPGEITRVRQNIREQLISADKNRFDNCAAQIGTAYKVNVSYIRHLVEGWLSKQDNATLQLIEICVNGELAEEKRKCRSFLKNVESLGIQLQNSAAENPHLTKGECCWVPATFCNKFNPPMELPCEAIEDPLYEDSSLNTDKENLSTCGSKKTISELTYRTQLLLCQENEPLYAIRSTETPPNPENCSLNNEGARSTKNDNMTKHRKRLEEKSVENQTGGAKEGDGKPKKKIWSGIKPVRIYGGVCLQPNMKIVPGTNLIRPTVQPVEIRGAKLGRNRGTKLPLSRRSDNSRAATNARASKGKTGSGGGSGGSDGEDDGGKKLNTKQKRRENKTSIKKVRDEHKPQTTAEAKLGPSGKPMMHISKKLPLKKAKEAAFYYKQAKMKPTRHSGHRATQSDHFHANKKDGSKVEGVHFTFGQGNTRFGWFKDRSKGKEPREPLKRNILGKGKAKVEDKD